MLLAQGQEGGGQGDSKGAVEGDEGDEGHQDDDKQEEEEKGEKEEGGEEEEEEEESHWGLTLNFVDKNMEIMGKKGG